jgi:hypothetical protein
MQVRTRHLWVGLMFSGFGLAVLLYLVFGVTRGEDGNTHTVAVSILARLSPSPTRIHFGITNSSSSKLCFEPSGYRVYNARQYRLLSVPANHRTNVLLNPGQSAVLSLDAPLDGQVWRAGFSVTPPRSASAYQNWGIWSRLFRRSEEPTGGTAVGSALNTKQMLDTAGGHPKMPAWPELCAGNRPERGILRGVVGSDLNIDSAEKPPVLVGPKSLYLSQGARKAQSAGRLPGSVPP